MFCYFLCKKQFSVDLIPYLNVFRQQTLSIQGHKGFIRIIMLR